MRPELPLSHWASGVSMRFSLIQKPGEAPVLFSYLSGLLLAVYFKKKIYATHTPVTHRHAFPSFFSLVPACFFLWYFPLLPLYKKIPCVLGSTRHLAYAMNANQINQIALAQYKESFLLFCNSLPVSVHIWSLSLHFHRERFQTSLSRNPLRYLHPK